MFQVRIHGRGGQGVVTAAELLSVAAFLEGARPGLSSFGSERMGAPVVAFCRIDDKEIRLREPILEPDALIVQDPTLFKAIDVCRASSPRLSPGQQQSSLSDLHLDAAPNNCRRGTCSPCPPPSSRSSMSGVRCPMPLCSAPSPGSPASSVAIGRRRDPRGISGKDRRGEYRRRHRRA